MESQAVERSKPWRCNVDLKDLSHLVGMIGSSKICFLVPASNHQSEWSKLDFSWARGSNTQPKLSRKLPAGAVAEAEVAPDQA
jgi:hypothetical protein